MASSWEAPVTEDERVYLEEYNALMHCLHTAVAFDMHHDLEQAAVSAHHLRVGVNSALLNDSAMAELLMEKGVFTRKEYFLAIVRAAERELQIYKNRYPGIDFQ